MLSYYNQFTDKDTNFTYSIDNIVVDFVFKYSSSSQYVQDFLNSISNDFGIDVDYWCSSKFCEFYHNFNIKLDEGVSFYIGVGFNSVTFWERNYCRIDFNPNKVREYLSFIKIYNHLLIYCKPPVIKRYDLAIDMPFKREDCFLEKNNKKYVEIQTSLSDRTQYLGSRSSIGRVKLYNKQLESKLNTSMTRLEITLSPLMTYDEVLEQIPKITVIDDIQLVFSPVDKVSKTEFALIELILRCNGFDVLQKLDYRMRKKIERILDKYVQTVKLPKNYYSNIIAELFTYRNGFEVKSLNNYDDTFSGMHMLREVGTLEF